MADPRGFLKVERAKEPERSIAERLADAREVAEHASAADVKAQASRCMDCGIPFCHSACPVSNLIPEFNDLLYREGPLRAAERLLETNNFPEVTGRVCPAPCEASCVLNLEETPVAIKLVEKSLATSLGDLLFKPRVSVVPPSGKSVAIVGSGPAGMAAAQQLARAGHTVTVFERDDRIGGLLRYGIPDFKLDKGLIDRRVDQMLAEGVTFRTHHAIDASNAAELARSFDAVLLAVGARTPRDATLDGRELDGVHFAMDFLTGHNRHVAGDVPFDQLSISAKGKKVVVLGGGDTGSDCVGTSLRQGARSVLQLELMPRPPLSRAPQNPWPEWPLVMRTSSSHAEGEPDVWSADASIADAEATRAALSRAALTRDWAISTVRFHGDGAGVKALEAVRVDRVGGKLVPIQGTTFHIPCDLALLAMGFTGPERGVSAVIDAFGLATTSSGAVATDGAARTNVEKIYAAGDASRGQSLVVWAIAEGRRAAAVIDRALTDGAGN